MYSPLLTSTYPSRWIRYDS